MKKLLTASVLLIGTVYSAYAADLRPAYKAPPPVAPPPVFSWTGFYVGGNGGCGWYKTPTPQNFGGGDFGGPADIFAFDQQTASGCFAGGEIGYNYQFSGNWVIGVAADAEFGKISSFNQMFAVNDGNEFESSYESKLTAFGTARATLGYSFGNWLPYITGGFAWGSNKFSVHAEGDNTDHPISPSFSDTQTHTGWTIGAGLEYAITPNVFWRAEYLYLDLGSKHYNVTLDADTGVLPGLDFGRLKVNTFKTGLDWRFDWGSIPHF